MIATGHLESNLTESSGITRALAASGATALLGGSAVVAYFDPTQAHFFPVCPLYSLTGFACPGCGLTRGFHALFHGDIATAIHFNALTPIWAIIFGLVLVSLVLFAIRGRGLPFGKISPHWLWVLASVLLVFGILRNLPVYPFALLYP